MAKFTTIIAVFLLFVAIMMPLSATPVRTTVSDRTQSTNIEYYEDLKNDPEYAEEPYNAILAASLDEVHEAVGSKIDEKQREIMFEDWKQAFFANLQAQIKQQLEADGNAAMLHPEK